MAAQTKAAMDEKIGGFRFVRTIHPGATSVVLEVIQESTQQAVRAEAAPRLARLLGGAEGVPVRGAGWGCSSATRTWSGSTSTSATRSSPISSWTCSRPSHLKLPIARPSVYPMPVEQLAPDHGAVGRRRWHTCTRRAGSTATSSPRTSW